MSRSSFTFNDIRKDYIFTLLGFSRPSWAPIKRDILKVAHRPGGYLLNTTTEERRIDVPFVIKAKNQSDLQKIKEDLANWLITDQPCELIFDDEPDRTYLAMLDGTSDLEELVYKGKGTLTFICPMPYKLGAKQAINFALDNYQLKATIDNKGTERSEPKFKITVTNPSTFLDIINKNGDQYFRMGYPVSLEKRTVEREQLILHDEMKSLIGWSELNNSNAKVDGGAIAGAIKVDGEKFTAGSFGSGSDWHGPAAKRSLTEPLQDFIIEAVVDCFNEESQKNIGRVEIYLLDENSNIIGKMAMSDSYRTVTQNQGEVRAGAINVGHHIIAETGDYSWTWNNFHGILRIVRVGNYWEGYITKLTSKGTHDSARFLTYTDVENKYMNKVAQIMVHIGSYSTDTSVKAAVHDIKVWKFNLKTELDVPYIMQTGDVVEVDTTDASITINGKDAIYTKDFMTDYITIEKGQNEISILPADIGEVEVTYRERYL
ncbi:phage tail family protein [Bacillus sp. TL12]|nr:phage tail family protein [Bacillus sp. TL12]